ncbi:Dolichyl-diphosphooligosaccharide-protein glycosyltransferase subunit dad1 [Chytriomyces hyalinus]|nr:Dolichyl-diphosphooligosaccharide-protein glycosyltransferase subunit dad1 [Chytriomyces hyalinus]KAJ3239158.1 Dolichyl-diphosphooligosaccharide-protein glycosyltransferase subunit dad1 [Chytriomyces hyalinus]
MAKAKGNTAAAKAEPSVKPVDTNPASAPTMSYASAVKSNISNPQTTKKATTAQLVLRLVSSYKSSTPRLLQLIDAYLACVMLSGVILFVYCVLVGTFPYNSFLSSFAASVGAFVLAGDSHGLRGFFEVIVADTFVFNLANLRMQLNPANDFRSLSPEAAFAEYAFCSIVFYGFVVNFLG